MKKIICLLGLLVLTSCAHNCCHKEGQCDMHKKEKCAKCGSEKCSKCDKDHAQCPMEKAADTTAPAAATPENK